MLETTNEVKPKSLLLRIINVSLVLFLIVVAPIPLMLTTTTDNIFLQILYAEIMFIFYIGIGFYAYRLLRKNISGPVFTKPNIRNWRGFWWLVGMWFLMIFIEVILAQLRVRLTGVTTTENQAAINELTSNLNVTMIAMVIYGTFLAPVVEELVFRGLILNYFFRKSWWWANIILSGLVFSLPHMDALPTNIADTLSFMIYASMGMVLAYIYKKTGDLKNSIAVHMMNNGITMIPLLVIAIRNAIQ
ncbi:CPBP family intramembrane metalloprotease [Leuconostoc koreense]|nr:CPBP family intramembrane metalloprotease [Leuconostoc mesenteroides]QGM25389.1 CPBP family intramembrane metalloprotease [Leuconostoc mesenteroides subsp. mesenteroides]